MFEKLAPISEKQERTPAKFQAYVGGLPANFDPSKYLVICTPLASLDASIVTLPARKEGGNPTTGLTPEIEPAPLAGGKRLHITSRWLTLRVGK